LGSLRKRVLREKAVTLTEIVIAVAVIGIIATSMAVFLTSSRSQQYRIKVLSKLYDELNTRMGVILAQLKNDENFRRRVFSLARNNPGYFVVGRDFYNNNQRQAFYLIQIRARRKIEHLKIPDYSNLTASGTPKVLEFTYERDDGAVFKIRGAGFWIKDRSSFRPGAFDLDGRLDPTLTKVFDYTICWFNLR